jgi:hypothetical protein
VIDYTRQAEAARPDTLADVQHRLSVALDACNELYRCAAGVLLSQQETQAEADKLRNAFETTADSRTLWKTRALAVEGTSEADDRYVTGHRPRRGSDVDLWIKRHRDSRLSNGQRTTAWHAFDDLLDDYRDHADTGVPLDREVQGPHPEQ